MTIPKVFERQARAVLVKHPNLMPRWSVISNGDGRELFIPKGESSGFDVNVHAETYGLYPFAAEWHGAPCGLFVYNYFGKRRVDALQNRHLPAARHT